MLLLYFKRRGGRGPPHETLIFSPVILTGQTYPGICHQKYLKTDFLCSIDFIRPYINHPTIFTLSPSVVSVAKITNCMRYI